MGMIEILTRWQIEALTLLSLLLQLILIVFGSKRKITSNKWINILVWSSYLSADWVATVALGILARSFPDHNASNPNYSLQQFWAPFILLHLGGPDTITAYSLEDNELWLRHLLGLFFEVGVAIYVFFRSWVDHSNHTLSLIAIPVYIAGIIKYGERTWVLRSSSSKHSKNPLKPSPEETEEEEPPQRSNDGDSEVFLHQAAFFLFKRLKVLFSGFLLDPIDGESSRNIIWNCSRSEAPPQAAFKLVEFELGLLYDVLYTKATIVHSRSGRIIRCITFLASVSALVSFSSINRASYLSVTICVTYLLLFGAVGLEVYALVIITSSDWTRVSTIWPKLGKVSTNDKRWSRAIVQYNLINDCLPKERTRCRKTKALIFFDQNLIQKKGVDAKLQDFIFNQLRKRTEKSPDYLKSLEGCKKLLNYRGDCVLEENQCLKELKWSTIDQDFNHSIVLWHIATELCYYDDDQQRSKIGKYLSNYMLYLLFICDMLPKGIGVVRCIEARNEITKVLRLRNLMEKEDACEYLLQHYLHNLDPSDVRNNNLLTWGCRLAGELQNLQRSRRWTVKKKWEMMNEVWMELLTYAASHCGWMEHGHQLIKGGELLTHVCVLMAHFGLSEQYRLYDPIH